VTAAGGDERADGLTRRALIGSGVVAGAALALVPRAFGGRPSARGSALATAFASDGVRAQAGPADHPAPAVVTRAEWGADESRRPGPIEFDDVVDKIVVHHTALDEPTGDWRGQVRRIYESETASGYRDIAYHYLVDPAGTIYEGRWARQYPANTTPDAEDGHGRSVRGGHARGHNPRTLGLALLGDYTHERPTDAALDALVELLVWKCARWKIDPHGATEYATLREGTQTFPNVVGHGTIRPTLCPGEQLESLLPDLRSRTADRITRAPGTSGGA
jgi:hypothetical protein